MQSDVDKVILTLDAGGTNFSFSAFRNGEETIDSFTYKAEVNDLNKCLDLLIAGFEKANNMSGNQANAISFSFPGPADYLNGIISNVGNLPAFKDGVALGPFLENHFKIPVFINNDGDLFTYGEAKYGLLPWVNSQLQKIDSPKRFRNLIGVTLGTGYGGGAFINGQMFIGDNSAAMEVWTTRNAVRPDCFTEEAISKRAITQYYGDNSLTPYDIFQIAISEKEGNQNKAKDSFELFGRALGDSLSDLITLFDGLVVIGGGLTGASSLFMPTVLKTINGSINLYDGSSKPRIVQQVYDLDDSDSLPLFLAGSIRNVTIPRTESSFLFDAASRTGIGISQLGTNKAVGLGAYAYAIDQLNKEKL